MVRRKGKEFGILITEIYHIRKGNNLSTFLMMYIYCVTVSIGFYSLYYSTASIFYLYLSIFALSWLLPVGISYVYRKKKLNDKYTEKYKLKKR